MRVDSGPGKGTRFEIALPTASATAAPEGARTTTASMRGNETILVVEDEPDLRSLAVTSLLDAGYSVLSAADGCEALRVLAAHDNRVDALVSDVVMPGMRGVQLARQLLGRSPLARVLLISGYTADIVLPDVDGQRFDFLQKPFAPSQLCQRLRALLNERGGWVEQMS